VDWSEFDATMGSWRQEKSITVRAFEAVQHRTMAGTRWWVLAASSATFERTKTRKMNLKTHAESCRPREFLAECTGISRGFHRFHAVVLNLLDCH
jgi:hypothetical protein